MKKCLLALLAAALPLFAIAQEEPDVMVKRVTDEVLEIIRSAIRKRSSIWSMPRCSRISTSSA
jgi:ABC-type transporter MlaC component